MIAILEAGLTNPNEIPSIYCLRSYAELTYYIIIIILALTQSWCDHFSIKKFFRELHCIINYREMHNFSFWLSAHKTCNSYLCRLTRILENYKDPVASTQILDPFGSAN